MQFIGDTTAFITLLLLRLCTCAFRDGERTYLF